MKYCKSILVHYKQNTVLSSIANRGTDMGKWGRINNIFVKIYSMGDSHIC